MDFEKMLIYSALVFGLFLMATESSQESADPSDLSIRIRVGSWWVTDNGAHRFTEWSDLRRLRSYMTITSTDSDLSKISITRSVTLLDFTERWQGTLVYWRYVNNVPSDQEEEFQFPDLEEMVDSNGTDFHSDINPRFLQPWCFITEAPTIREAVSEIGNRNLASTVNFGTPKYFEADPSLILSAAEVREKSGKVARHCRLATLLGNTYLLDTGSNSQDSQITISGQIDPAQPGKTVPFEIKINSLLPAPGTSTI